MLLAVALLLGAGGTPRGRRTPPKSPSGTEWDSTNAQRAQGLPRGLSQWGVRGHGQGASQGSWAPRFGYSPILPGSLSWGAERSGGSLTDAGVIREVQEKLYNLNYDISVLNGQMNEETRTAIREWQTNVKHEPTAS